MNEYHFPIVCSLWDNVGLVLMYEFMHVYIYLYMRVRPRCACMHACVYVLRMTLSMSKRKQNSWFGVRKYLLLPAS